MSLTEQQIDFISNSLTHNGINSKELKEDILDHICTAIETERSEDFESTYKKVIQQFGGYQNMKQIQRDTNYTIHCKKMLKARRALYVSLYAMASILIIGTLFKIMHWPFASYILRTGIIALALLCLPLFIYEKYMKSILKHHS